MTKERRLAIQMWEEIRAHIRDVPKLSFVDLWRVADWKRQFCLEHELSWMHNCWLCQYVRYRDTLHGEGCQRCPLSDGHEEAIIGLESGCYKNAYHRVIHARTRKAKLTACDEIIHILNGRLK